MKDVKHGLIVLDVFNNYSDILMQRLDELDLSGRFSLYVGDCVEYTSRLLEANSNIGRVEMETVCDILENVLRLVFIIRGIKGDFCWSLDKQYVNKN